MVSACRDRLPEQLMTRSRLEHRCEDCLEDVMHSVHSGFCIICVMCGRNIIDGDTSVCTYLFFFSFFFLRNENTRYSSHLSVKSVELPC